MNFWTMGRELDQKMFEFRNKGMNGTPEEREEFLKQVFHAARGNAGVLMLAAPAMGKTKQEVLEILMTKVMEGVAEQAKETGYDAKQTELYLEAHRKAYESLAEIHGLRPSPTGGRDAVIARYPHAKSDFIDAVYQYGQSSPYQLAYWCITSSEGLGATELGRGETEEDAWADAASKLSG